jgi:hypothetical protein
MDTGKSIGFVFEDEEWGPKVLIGGLANLVPIVNLAAWGYAVRTLQNVAAGEERPLPDWNGFGDHFVRGLRLLIGAVIYFLPLVVLNLTVIIARNLTEAPRVGNLVVVAISALACLQAVYALLVAVWLPAAVAVFAGTGNLASLFRFGKTWSLIWCRPGGYVTVLLVGLAVHVVAGLTGVALCLIGLTFTTFVYYLVFAHLLGQLRREGEQPEEAPAIAA